MKSILKFEIPILQGKFTLKIPLHWQFFSFQNQNNKPTIWIGGDLEEETADVPFQIIGTGYQLPKNSDYLGTIQMNPFVWHLFVLLFDGKYNFINGERK
jgi:hypothetical protein